MSSAPGIHASTAYLPLVLTSECAVLIPWQKHCHILAVDLTQTLQGWHAAAQYTRKRQGTGFAGLFDAPRGPYPSRQAAIRNTIAHLVHHMLHMGLTTSEAVTIYHAAGIPIPPRWPHPSPTTEQSSVNRSMMHPTP